MRALLSLVDFISNLCYVRYRVFWTQGRIAQIIYIFTIPRNISLTFVVVISSKAFYENRRRTVIEFEKDKIAILRGQGACTERDHLNSCFVARAFQDLIELSSHDARPTDVTVQHGFVQQDAIAWRISLLQHLLSKHPDLYALLKYRWLHLRRNGLDYRPGIVLSLQ